MLQVAVFASRLRPLGVGDAKFHSLQYADDLLLFLDGETNSAHVVKGILEDFSGASGLEINFAKSAIYPVNLDRTSVDVLAGLFGCPVGAFPFTYLGLPLSPSSLRRADFLPLIEKLDKRLAGWKGLLLSRAGRLVLLNSVLSSIPAFFCSAFVIPAWARHAIDKIRRGFFWKGRKLDNGFHCLVSWDRICRPKRSGGLGVRNLKAMNFSLLSKALWGFYKDNSKPWARLIRSLHYKRRHLCAAGPTPAKCSPFWRGALSVVVPFSVSIAFQLGDGKLASFWHSRWVGDSTLRNRFPTLYAASPLKNISVYGWFCRFRSLPCFGIHVTTSEGLADLSSLGVLTSSIVLSNNADTVLWRWDRAGAFSVHSSYNFLMFDGVDDTVVRHLWRLKAPPKVKLFLWLALRNRVLTADILSSRGWIGPSMCCMCGSESECLNHLLFTCSFARGVWNWLLVGEQGVSGVLLLNAEGNLAARWLRTRGVTKGHRKKLFDLCFIATCWELWLARNRCIFDDKSCSVTLCADNVVNSVNSWLIAFPV